MSILSKNKIILGLSGGVDSTAAALLLQEKGFEVIGFYFDVLGKGGEGLKKAALLAEQLQIRFIFRDISRVFSQRIIENFCREYSRGKTPNPCVLCNQTVKFKLLLEIADQEGAYYIGTGHYANVARLSSDGLFYIQRGANLKKDQSYMLYRLGQDVLSRLILPLGNIQDKEKTRELARKYGMSNAESKDSQEICFIDEEKETYISFMERKGYCFEKGNFVDSSGNILGMHQGIGRYTVGQRKGLGIAMGKPTYVTAIRPDRNEVVLGDQKELFHSMVFSTDNFFSATSSGEIPSNLIGKQGLTAKIRYGANPASAILKAGEDGRVITTFAQPQRAPAPGQSIVFYDGDTVVGGGFIDNENTGFSD